MRTYLPNVIIFCGSGRNVGKTAMICSVIKKVSKLNNIIAVKVSPHFHLNPPLDSLVWKSDGCNIYQEKEINTKDSSLFLQVGSKTVYYIETKDEYLEMAFNKVLQLTGDGKIMIVESGILGKFIKPGVLVYLESEENKPLTESKFSNRENADLILSIHKDKLSEDVQNINQKVFVIDGIWKLR